VSIDYIEIDGHRFETELAYSTGSSILGGRSAGGYKGTDVLDCEGAFWYEGPIIADNLSEVNVFGA